MSSGTSCTARVTDALESSENFVKTESLVPINQSILATTWFIVKLPGIRGLSSKKWTG